MKKILIFFLVIILSIGGYFLYQHLKVPESTKILAEMHRVFESNQSDSLKLLDIDMLKDRLASAYIREGNYDRAIQVIEQEIEKTRHDGESDRRFYGRRHSASYGLEAAQFRQLASVYAYMKDTGSAGKANKKAEILEAAELRARKSEPKKKSVLD